MISSRWVSRRLRSPNAGGWMCPVTTLPKPLLAYTCSSLALVATNHDTRSRSSPPTVSPQASQARRHLANSLTSRFELPALRGSRLLATVTRFWVAFLLILVSSLPLVPDWAYTHAATVPAAVTCCLTYQRHHYLGYAGIFTLRPSAPAMSVGSLPLPPMISP